MFGYFKQIRCIRNKNDDSEQKPDKKFCAVIAVFAAVIVITIIRAGIDASVREQVSELKLSVTDGLILALAAGGHFILKRSGRK